APVTADDQVHDDRPPSAVLYQISLDRAVRGVDGRAVVQFDRIGVRLDHGERSGEAGFGRNDPDNLGVLPRDDVVSGALARLRNAILGNETNVAELGRERGARVRRTIGTDRGVRYGTGNRDVDLGTIQRHYQTSLGERGSGKLRVGYRE